MEDLVQFDQGSYLLRQNDFETHAFVIQSGSVKIFITEDGKEQILNIASAGDVIGEMALFENAPRSASVVALESTSAFRVSRQYFQELIQTDPAACAPFFQAVLGRLRTSNSMLLAAQQTRELVQTTRVKLSLTPTSEQANQLFPRPISIEVDVTTSQGVASLAKNDLAKHFQIQAEAYLPHMQR
jgi:CRP-like cAMP-binding protein